MGIELFFSSLQKNNITNLKTSFTKTLQQQLDAEYLYIDFNSIVYVTRNKIVMDFNYMLYKIITNRYREDKRCQKIIKEYYIDEQYLTPEKFHKRYTDDGLDKKIINKVLEYTINITTNYVKPNKLKHLYIAIDGVPSKSKMVEQKNRRYMGSFISEMAKIIFDKHRQDLQKNHQKRYLFEKYKIGWSRNKITPGTPFMDMLNKGLTSSRFELGLKKSCKNLKSYIFSGPYEPGEGEKKIVDHMRSLKQDKSSYVIYSPDSDVTLLGLILNTKVDNRKISNLQILRHNQQKDNYDVIDIDMLAANLYSYAVGKLDAAPDRDSVIRDIVFILTVFGNDFVPKILSFSARHDFNLLIDKYIKVIKENRDKSSYNYMIDIKSNRRVLDQDIFIKVIRELHLDEGGNLQKVYMSNNYRNYNRLKRIILRGNSDNFTLELNKFLTNLRLLNKAVETNKDLSEWSKNIVFSKQLQDTTRLSDIESYAAYYRQNRRFPRAVSFQRYQDSFDNFHRDRLKRSLEYLGPNTEPTKYDIEMYKFNNMFDEYRSKLDAKRLNLGYISVDPRTNTWKSEKIVEGVQRYYKEFFNISGSLDTNKNPKLKSLVKEYLEGLVWVFEYYYNNFSEKYNRGYSDTWFYSYRSSPLLTQIYSYLDKNRDRSIIKGITNELTKYRVDKKGYFNCLEHLMYTSPAPNIKSLIPKEYRKFADSKFYPDISKMAKDTYYNRSKSVDCRGVIFLNKCHLVGVHTYKDYNKDRQFIKTLRKIKLSHDSRSRSGEYRQDKPNINTFIYGDIVPLDTLHNNQTGGSIKSCKQKYIAYKKRYLDTKDKKYKKEYKRYKYMLFNLRC